MLYVQKIVYPELINSGPGNIQVKEAKKAKNKNQQKNPKTKTKPEEIF